MRTDHNSTATQASLSIDGPATPEHLADVRRRVEEFLRQGLAERLEDFPLDLVLLALQEAIANVARHAYPQEHEAGPLGVVVELDEEALRLRVRDHGPGYDPERVPRPAQDPPTPGGYGLYLIREIMSSVEYLRGDHYNELRMERRLAAVEA